MLLLLLSPSLHNQVEEDTCSGKVYIPQLLIKIQIYFSTLNFMVHLAGPNRYHLADNFVAGFTYAYYTILMHSRVDSSSLQQFINVVIPFCTSFSWHLLLGLKVSVCTLVPRLVCVNMINYVFKDRLNYISHLILHLQCHLATLPSTGRVCFPSSWVQSAPVHV